MAIKSRQQLGTLMSMSGIESVRMAAANTEVMRHIFQHIDPQIDYSKVVEEFSDPRFQKWAAQYRRKVYGRYYGSKYENHPGRSWIRVLYPQPQSHFTNLTDSWNNPVNLYGLIAHRQRFAPTTVYNLTLENSTHDDLDRVLTQLGYKRFKSKRKQDKIRMLLRHNPDSAQ